MVAIAVSTYIGLEIEVMARRGDEETINSASTPPSPLSPTQQDLGTRGRVQAV